MTPRSLIVAALCVVSTMALAQSSPNLTYGQVPTPAQWNAFFSGKQDALTFTPLNRAGDTLVGPLRTAAATINAAGLSVSPGTPPTNPQNGDVWLTNAGLYVQAGGVTIGPLMASTGVLTGQVQKAIFAKFPTIPGASWPDFVAQYVGDPSATDGTYTAVFVQPFAPVHGMLWTLLTTYLQAIGLSSTQATADVVAIWMAAPLTQP